MPLDPNQKAEIENRFTYHPPTPEQAELYTKLRDQFRELALTVAEFTPASREQSLAMIHLEQANFYANAAIARRSQ